MKILILFVLSVSVVLLDVTESAGCLCRREPISHAIKRLRKEARVIFMGRVTDVVKEGVSYRASLAIEKSWKGDQHDDVTIYSGGGCMVWFEKGQEYLVYGYKDNENRLQTDMCMRTRPIPLASEDLKRLGKPKVTRE